MKRKILPYNPALKELARKLRNEMTLCEVLLWNELKQKKLGVDFDRQRPINNYIIDFYCKDLMLAIEVDGATHFTEEGVERDKIRQEKLEALGVRFLRFDDDDIKDNINGVLEIIRSWIEKNMELSSMNPPPDPSKEGSKIPRRKKDSSFHFKQFSVRHDRSGMKVGTDGVLLGAWTDISSVKNILDIGTGTGVIALMLAQRTEAAVELDAIEIDSSACIDAAENFMASPWKERLRLHQSAIQDFKSELKYELIVTNPPYFQNSYHPPDDQRKTARHTHALAFEDLLNATDQFLSPSGRLSIILPFTEGLQFITLANARGYSCSRKWSFRSRLHKPIERWLLEFTEKGAESTPKEGEIVLYNSGEEWSEVYQNLTRYFYLKL